MHDAPDIQIGGTQNRICVKHPPKMVCEPSRGLLAQLPFPSTRD